MRTRGLRFWEGDDLATLHSAHLFSVSSNFLKGRLLPNSRRNIWERGVPARTSVRSQFVSVVHAAPKSVTGDDYSTEMSSSLNTAFSAKSMICSSMLALPVISTPFVSFSEP